ncbi:MAG TPA: aminotransferase class III-fold pyridoxal phosphate-dependent enzyme [Candidatus Dormibacteraeota bacterium]|nr:aminotransferase class III-fold pyridoxal phosphate-dependent enzyme [Candidatus Dormibacteraeota bacterium]
MSHLLKPRLGETLPSVARAEGSWVWDTDGRRYLDGSSGAIVVSLGHGHPEVLRALREQSERVTYAVRAQFTNADAERLATRLAELAPGDLDAVFLVNSGSEAVEAAIKFALQYWSERGRPGKHRFISRHGSYHGTTLGGLSLSGHPVRRRHFEPLLHPFPAVPQPSRYRCAASAGCPPCDLSCADAFDAAIRAAGADQVAAVIVEPVVGATGGAVVAPPGYHQRLREICDRHDVLLIADEVLTGVGRCGAFLAMERWDTVPDLVALGKGLGAGYVPVAAVLASSRVVGAIGAGSGQFTSGHTYSANPLAAAVANTVVDITVRDGLAERARRLEPVLGAALGDLLESHPLLGDVRGLGLLWGLELVADRASRRPFPRDGLVTERFIAVCQANGLLLYPASDGVNDAVLVGPPLNVSEADLDELVSRIDASLTALEAEVGLS